MTDRHTRKHLSAEKLQALLEGELRRAERARAEEHVHGCARCSSELDAWRALFSELAELPALGPSEGFARAVMAEVDVPGPLPLGARVRQRLGALAPALAGQRHVVGRRLQDFLDGSLAAPRAARVEEHLAACADCAEEARSWRLVFERLATVGRFAPAEGFAERVMAEVRVPALAPAPAPVPGWSRLLTAARGLLPRTRRAWAAISGAAVTPAAVAGLALYVVFSHPTLTPGALLSFAWWKAAALSGALWQTLVAVSLESAQLFGLYSVAETVSGAPVAVAGGVLAYSLASALALKVLYKNLVASRPSSEHPHARLSAS